MTAVAQSTVTLPVRVERCDRCSARACVSTTFLVGEQLCDLLWCGHHFAANEAKIREIAVCLEDQRAKVGETAYLRDGREEPS